MLQQTAKTRKSAELIQAPTVARVTDKLSGECLGYLVKSNSSKEYYQVTYSHIKHAYQCTCAAYDPEKGNGRYECRHVKAVREVVAARRELAAAATVQTVPVVEVMAEAQVAMEQVEDKEQIAAQAEAENMKKLADIRATYAYEELAAVKLAPKTDELESCIYCGHLCKGIMCATCTGV